MRSSVDIDGSFDMDERDGDKRKGRAARPVRTPLIKIPTEAAFGFGTGIL